MKFEDLKIIDALFQEPNLTKTAERLHMSQSNLSKIIKRVEDELGFRLFERRGFHGLRPTEQGLLLAGRVQKFSRSWEDTLALVKNNDGKRIDIKVTGPGLYMRNVFLPRWFSAGLSEKYRLSYAQVRMDQVSQMAEATDLDLVVTHLPFELKDWVPIHIFTERFAIFGGGRNLPESLADFDLRDKRWIGYRAANEVLDRFFARHQIPASQIDAYIDDVESILDIIADGAGVVALLPSHAARSHAKVKHWALPDPLGQKLYLMYRAEQKTYESLIKDLRRLLRE